MSSHSVVASGNALALLSQRAQKPGVNERETGRSDTEI